MSEQRDERIPSALMREDQDIPSPGTVISISGMYTKDFTGSRVSVDVPTNDDLQHLARSAAPPTGYGTGVVDPDGDGPAPPVTISITLSDDI